MLNVVLYYGLSLVTVLVALVAVSGRPRLFWVAALTSWLLSCIGTGAPALPTASFTLVLAFVFLALAVGHSCARIGCRRQAMTFIVLGVGLWAVAGVTVGDRLLWPVQLMMQPVLARSGTP
jgi:hypothetical protein